MRLLGGKNSVSFVMSQAASFPTTDTKFKVIRRMKGGWVQAEDLYRIIIFFEHIVKRTLENP